jgi:hypothetical protein
MVIWNDSRMKTATSTVAPPERRAAIWTKPQCCDDANQSRHEQTTKLESPSDYRSIYNFSAAFNSAIPLPI